MPTPKTFDITKGARLGVFGTEFGGYIELYGDWIPDPETPEDAAVEMLQVAGYLSNIEVPMLEAQRIAIEDTKRRFDTETSPDGEPWVHLSREYRKRKVEIEGYPDRILVREEFLMDTAASASAWKVIGPVLIFDPEALPKSGSTDFNYGAFHQGLYPRKHFESVPLFGDFESGGAKPTGEREAIAGVNPRPFIGLSDQGVTEIEAAFSGWFNSPLVGGFYRSGGYQQIVRTPHGPRFTGMGTPPAQGM